VCFSTRGSFDHFSTEIPLGLYGLTPKIPCVFVPNFAVFDIVGKINFSKNKSMRI
jgi:hypothetical protein